MTVNEYAAWRRENKPHFLLDVRRPEEHEAARLDGAVLIPLAELPARLAELPKGLPLVVLCHHGRRSAHAVHHLREAGFDALNLTGGKAVNSVMDNLARALERVVKQNEELRDAAGQALNQLAHERERLEAQTPEKRNPVE